MSDPITTTFDGDIWPGDEDLMEYLFLAYIAQGCPDDGAITGLAASPAEIARTVGWDGAEAVVNGLERLATVEERIRVPCGSEVVEVIDRAIYTFGSLSSDAPGSGTQFFVVLGQMLALSLQEDGWKPQRIRLG